MKPIALALVSSLAFAPVAFADPVPAVAETHVRAIAPGAPTEAPTPAPKQETSRYADRQATDKAAADFEGGGFVIVIGGGALLLILVLLILVI